MAKLLVYGSLNVDYVYQVPHFVQPGETLLSSSRSVFAGGKGLNQAVALARAGGDVYFAGAVGDQDGSILTDVLKSCEINCDHLKVRSGEPSGHTFIQVDSSGQNCILLYGGTNRSIPLEDIDAAISNFSAGDFLIVQNETNDVAYAIKKAHEQGLKVCINASPLDEAIFKMPLDLCSFIIVNEIEGSSLVGESPAMAESDPYLILNKLTEKYPNTAFVLTLGSRGSIFAPAKSDEAAKAALQSNNAYGLKCVSCRAFKVDAVDTTAAGDTFLGYFISQIAAGEDAKTSLQNATAASAIAVAIKGATPSIPRMHEVKSFMGYHDSTIVDSL